MTVKTPRLNEAIYHLEQHIKDMQMYNTIYEDSVNIPHKYESARCRVCGHDPMAILSVLMDIRTELTDLVATDTQSQDKPLKSATPTPLSKQEDSDDGY